MQVPIICLQLVEAENRTLVQMARPIPGILQAVIQLLLILTATEDLLLMILIMEEAHQAQTEA